MAQNIETKNKIIFFNQFYFYCWVGKGAIIFNLPSSFIISNWESTLVLVRSQQKMAGQPPMSPLTRPATVVVVHQNAHSLYSCTHTPNKKN